MKSVFSQYDDDELPPSIWQGGDTPSTPPPQGPAADSVDAIPAQGAPAPSVFSGAPPDATGPTLLRRPSPNPSGPTGAPPPPAVPQVFSPLDQNENAGQAKLTKLQQQDANPWGSPTNHPGTLGKIAHGLSVAGQIAGSIFAPHVLADIPGTEAYRAIHEQKLGQEVNDIEKEKVGNALTVAQTKNQDAQPELKAKASEIKSLEDQEKNRHNMATEGNTANKNTALMTEHGLKLGPDGNPVADEASPFYQEQQMKMGVQEANREYIGAKTAFENMKGDPNSIINQQIRQRLALAGGNLGLRQKEYMMHAFGTDGNGQALNGAFIGDDGNPIGTALQGNVKPTGQQRDAAGRAEIGEDLRGRILAQLKDPAIRSQLGPVLGRAHNFQEAVGNLPPELSGLATDLTSYAAFMAGQHPVRGIGALQYFDKVVGGLGQTPEQLEGKLQSGHSTAQDVIKMGAPRVHGSNAEGPGATQTFHVGNDTYHIPVNRVADFKKAHPDAK